MNNALLLSVPIQLSSIQICVYNGQHRVNFQGQMLNIILQTDPLNALSKDYPLLSNYSSLVMLISQP